MNGSSGPRLRVAVLGAGPIGLEAALAANESGYGVTIYEAGSRPAAHVRDWGHVRLFSPWRMNVSQRMRRALADLDLVLDVDEESSPTGRELVDRVLDPLWRRSPVAEHLRLDTRVVAVGREGVLKHEEIAAPERARRPFRILLRSPGGREWVEHADVVLDCTGKYGNPNTLGDAGIPAPGETSVEDRIGRRIPDFRADAEPWKGRTVLLVGSGHSAQTAARDLAEIGEARVGTKVIWALRRDEPDLGAVEDDPLPGRRELSTVAGELLRGSSRTIEARTGVVVDSLRRDNGSVGVSLRRDDGTREEVEVDRILALTGGVGDHTLYRQLQVHECYATSGPMKLSAALLGADGGDCLTEESHGVETLKSPEPNFFLLGDKSYGRNNTFLLRIGWQQVDEVFEELARAS
ncbi:MAG: NAD-binding protein [Gemmatimonadota bacterium]